MNAEVSSEAGAPTAAEPVEAAASAESEQKTEEVTEVAADEKMKPEDSVVIDEKSEVATDEKKNSAEHSPASSDKNTEDTKVPAVEGKKNSEEHSPASSDKKHTEETKVPADQGKKNSEEMAADEERMKSEEAPSVASAENKTEESKAAADEEKNSEEHSSASDDKNTRSTDEEKNSEEPPLSSAPVEKCSSFREESNFLSDLKEAERKALVELRAKVEEAILENKLFKKQEEEKPKEKKEDVKDKDKGGPEAQEGGEGESTKLDQAAEAKAEEAAPSDEKAKLDQAAEERARETASVEEKAASLEEKPVQLAAGEAKDEETAKAAGAVSGEEKASPLEEKAVEAAASKEEETPDPKAQEGEKAKLDQPTEEKSEETVSGEEKAAPSEEKAVEAAAAESREVEAIDNDITLWGVALLPSKGSESTDVILLKFLRARDFKVKDAFEMLQNVLRWRKESNIDSILEETLGAELAAACYMDGVDREGHQMCYNVSGVFQDDKLYQKTFVSEEGREKFLRWRVQLMEKGIKTLDFKPGGVASLLQITDLKNSPGPSKKELRTAMKQVVQLLQDNYPEFVARNIFINVPFWYYAFHALISPFLTQRTRSKFVFARPSKVSETLLKYVPAEAIPVRYGGLKRDNDSEFSTEDDGVSELIVKASSIECVEIPAPEAGTSHLWDLTVLGWEVTYKEEFVPTDEGSYTIVVRKTKKMGAQEEPIRNSFRNNEPGKIILTIENNTFWKKKVLYRYKTKSS